MISVHKQIETNEKVSTKNRGLLFSKANCFTVGNPLHDSTPYTFIIQNEK